MPPTPVVLGAVIILVLISMIAAHAIGVIGLTRALGTVVVVAVLVVPLGFLSTLYTPAAHDGGGEHGKGDPAKGEALYRAGACPTCHTIQGVSTGTIGPELTRVGTVAATRKPGVAAEAYLRESIENPNAFAPAGFSTGLMPQGLATGQNLDDLVAYLLTKI